MSGDKLFHVPGADKYLYRIEMSVFENGDIEARVFIGEEEPATYNVKSSHKFLLARAITGACDKIDVLDTSSDFGKFILDREDWKK